MRPFLLIFFYSKTSMLSPSTASSENLSTRRRRFHKHQPDLKRTSPGIVRMSSRFRDKVEDATTRVLEF